MQIGCLPLAHDRLPRQPRGAWDKLPASAVLLYCLPRDASLFILPSLLLVCHFPEPQINVSSMQILAVSFSHPRGVFISVNFSPLNLPFSEGLLAHSASFPSLRGSCQHPCSLTGLIRMWTKIPNLRRREWGLGGLSLWLFSKPRMLSASSCTTMVRGVV